MPRRKIVLATSEIYHVFNRSIASEEIFSSIKNLNKILEVIDYYRLPQKIRLSKFKDLITEIKAAYVKSLKDTLPLVEIYAFSMMPNHYHFILKQIQDGGIARFVSNFQNSFAKIFNLKNKRVGALFQNSFKAKRIETDEELLHVSRYIHLNPVTSYLIEFKDLATYPWTSFPYYFEERKGILVDTNLILGLIGSRKKYFKFVSDQVDYQRKLSLIKNLILE